MARRARAARSSSGGVETVLVPLDGSKLAEAAIGVAERVGAELVLLSVLAPVNPAHLVRADDSAPYRTLQTRNAKAQQYLEAVRMRLRRRGSRARILVRSGDPAREIPACADAERVQLIAMSTHGRSGLRRTLFGSVAEAVLRRASVPVLLVRGTAARARR
jgi:nucleotide-binding universal stress UspA family protein